MRKIIIGLVLVLSIFLIFNIFSKEKTVSTPCQNKCLGDIISSSEFRTFYMITILEADRLVCDPFRKIDLFSGIFCTEKIFSLVSEHIYKEQERVCQKICSE